MAKVNKSLLKSIVKECLVEILMEGIDGEASSNLIENRKRKAAVLAKNERKNREIEERRKQLDSQIVGNITQDPIMAEILRDTANTTLQEQIENKPGRANYVPHDNAAKIAYESDPGDIFSGAANWSELAFSSAKKV